jgi:adenylosuccinate synthase
MDKVKRSGLRMHLLGDMELFAKKLEENVEQFKKLYGHSFKFDMKEELAKYHEYAKRILPMLADTSYYLNNAIDNGKTVLLEGANGTLLDIDHGTYPFVTSSNASIGGVITGSGISALKLKSAIGIMKAYTTRVGEGPFPSELKNALGDQIREQGGEYGATTGRPRRCGWFDAVVGKYSNQINGFTSINLTKLDVLSGLPVLQIANAYYFKGQILKSFPSSLEVLENVEVRYEEMPGWKEDISKAKTFEELPINAQNYVRRIEELVGAKVGFIGVGMKREEMITCP